MKTVVFETFLKFLSQELPQRPKIFCGFLRLEFSSSLFAKLFEEWWNDEEIFSEFKKHFFFVWNTCINIDLLFLRFCVDWSEFWYQVDYFEVEAPNLILGWRSEENPESSDFAGE